MTDSDCQEARPGPFFSDRLWTLKLGLTVALFTFLCTLANRQIGEILPDIELGALGSPSVLGKSVHLWARQVVAVTADGFDIDTKVGPFHVQSPFPLPAVDDYVSFAARITGPRRVVASAFEVNHGYLWKRGLNYGLSSAVVIVFLWIVRRRFRGRLSEGLFRSRY